MKITFYSNFLNHHQLPFCKEMVKLIGNNFKFVATEKIPHERIELGYEDMNDKYNFVVKEYENPTEASRLAKTSDVIIIGSAPNKYMHKAIKNNVLCFRYSERIHRNGFSLKMWLSLIKNFTFKERRNTYLLCSSAYTSMDFAKSFAYINRTYKWGYFPEVKIYKNINDIINKKEMKSILWVSRFIKLKHPEIVIDLASKLKKDGYNFTIRMIGIGEEEHKISEMIRERKIEKNVKLLGSMSPADVRKEMEKSQIFLFTSDRREGWGAVLNEAMNSGCAVVANSEIGSVPFLIKNKNNGLIYEDKNFENIYKNVTTLLNDQKLCKKIGVNAYETMINIWNPKLVANRFIELANCLKKNKKCDKFLDGPCSKANRLKDYWYKDN